MTALLALLLAVPAEARLTLTAGARHIEKIVDGVAAVESEGPLRAELLPSGNELLLETAQPGLARVFLFLHREVRVLEVAIDVPFPPPGPAPTCAVVKDAACYAQFRAAPREKVIFALGGMQAEARAAQELLDQAGLTRVQVALSPFGVQLRGCADEAQKRLALRTIWPAILGRLRLDE